MCRTAEELYADRARLRRRFQEAQATQQRLVARFTALTQQHEALLAHRYDLSQLRVDIETPSNSETGWERKEGT